MLKRALRGVGNLALPPRCPGCGEPVGADGRFCATCWNALRFLGPPWCAACHVPFAYDEGEGALCDDCVARPPRHRGVRAAVAYGPIAREMALKLKYGGRIGIAETMAALMQRHLPTDAEVIVPVPLHRWRLWQRGYNQAGLIARSISRRARLPCLPTALLRVRHTPTLRGLDGGQRSRAVADAFRAADDRRAAIARRAVVLVDDVHTSGATSAACAAALLDAGARSVTVLCWARVIAADD